MTKRLNQALVLAAAGLYCIISAPLAFADTAETVMVKTTQVHEPAMEDGDRAELAFGDNGAEPAALNSELAYTTELRAKETVVAVGYQQSREALALGLPEQRFITSASMTIFTGTTLSLEYYLDQDYSMADSGTDEDGYSFTTRLAYEL